MTGSSLRERRKDAVAPSLATPLTNKAQSLVSWDELPEWMKDNEYILSGYRRQTNSVLACIHSIYAYTHNETVNIHSHLWGALLFVFFLLTFSTRLATYQTADTLDVLGFAIFLTAAVLCLSFSALYHTMGSHSQAMMAVCHTLDYLGIVVLIVGSWVPCMYYSFYCDPYFGAVYVALILAAGSLSAYVVLSPKYSRPSYRGARVAVFIGMGLCGVLPTMHAMYSHGYNTVLRDLGFSWFMGSGVCYIVGALIYANRFPERWWPGSFDHWGASHQIFHAHVVVAALLHYGGIQRAAYYWHGVLQGTCVALT